MRISDDLLFFKATSRPFEEPFKLKFIQIHHPLICLNSNSSSPFLNLDR